MKKSDLINFELDIKNLYEKKKIKAPIHLSGNNEEQLIKIFKKIKKMTGYFKLEKPLPRFTSWCKKKKISKIKF